MSDHAAAPDPEQRRLPTGLRLALLLVAPLLLIGPSLLPGYRFLPQAPVVYPPLSLEYPEAAARARVGLNYWTGDRIFPVLYDQLEFRERVFAGRSLLWDDDQSLGLPLLGNAIHGPFYPPNLLALIAPPDRAAGPLAILSLLLAGAGLWALLARLGTSEAACAVGAIALQTTGWGVANLHYGMKVDAALWLPWCLWAVEGLRARRAPSGPLLAGFIACSFLAGFPPIAAFVLAATGLAAIVRLRSARAWAGFAGACALGLALALPQLVPSAAASADSYRTVKDAEAIAAEAAPPATSLGLVVPQLFGKPTELAPPFGPVAAWWLSDNDEWERAQTSVPLEWDPFAGVVTVLLALAGVVCGGRRAIAPAALVLLAFGWAQAWPGFELLYRIPGLGGGAPTRAMAVAWIGWAWLAAVGVDGLRSSAGRRASSALGLVGVGALALGAAFMNGDALIQAQEQRWSAAHGTPLEEVRQVLPPLESAATAERLSTGFVVTGLAALLLAGSSVIAGRRRSHGPLLAAAGLVLLFEAVTVSSPHVQRRDLGGVPLVPESEAMGAVLDAAGDGRVLRYDPSPSGLEDVVDLARPNMVALYGGRDASAYVAFTPKGAVDFFAGVDPATRVRSGVGRLPSLDLVDHERLDAARITCILAREPIEHPRLELSYWLEGFAVHRRLGAAPDAWAVDGGDELAAPYQAIEVERRDGTWRVAKVAYFAIASIVHTNGTRRSSRWSDGWPRTIGGPGADPSGLVKLHEWSDPGPLGFTYTPPYWRRALAAAALAFLLLVAWSTVERVLALNHATSRPLQR
ncbi:hypothetical protein [Engelhardtia mirabilis]|uniref:Bacterial membrane protein YfhO n=1 Tax=Engelhardtia mirabilis TaxID=2528011 RepID=A0A518BJH3_9BACT|nr:hypothetical protein Pla133_21710 [Planctomycetes bacterium Pla133]QDV01420.1 hypothetical protein Pla86_21710 [Planctomycetes bacterium Pla86]